MAVVYPFSELDEPDKLVALVGSFWSEVFNGRDLVTDLLFARGQLDVQAQLDFMELLAAMSRFAVPIWHTDNWAYLSLRESERNQTSGNLARFNGQYTFSSGLQFDVPATTVYHVWNAPSNLANVRVVLNSITHSSVILTQGVDFFLHADGTIWFRENPFDNDLVSKTEEFTDGVVTDRLCNLWFYRGQWDWNTVYRQFGYAVASRFKSSRVYRDFVNAVYDGLVEGTTQRCISQLFSAIADVPPAKSAEVVEIVTNDRNGLVIVTDKNAYRFPAGSTALVAVNDTVLPGDSLVDTVQFFEFGRGQFPSAEELRSLAVGGGFLKEGYFADLIFENKTVPLVVELDVSGYTKVSFELGGFSGDVEQFWNQVHAAGIAAGQTLAMLLDQRTNKAGQPTALALPTTINPFGFLAQNVLRNNAYVIKIKPQYFGPNALGLSAASILRKLVPPHTACFITAEFVADTDTVTMDGTGDATRAGYSENVTTYQGTSVSEEVYGLTYVTETVRCYQIAGRCE